jgi:hypothetical protein
VPAAPVRDDESVEPEREYSERDDDPVRVEDPEDDERLDAHGSPETGAPDIAAPDVACAVQSLRGVIA